MSNILVLAGSVRKGGNTDILVQSFAEGAKEKNTVEIISVADVQVHPCTGCDSCFRTEGNRCIQEDDMSAIYEKLKAADVLVIASPVYFYGVSAQLKAVIDRLHNPIRNEFRIKQLALILVGAAQLPQLFDAIKMQYQMLLDFFHLEDAGMVLVRGAGKKGDVVKGDGPAKAFALGRSIE